MAGIPPLNGFLSKEMMLEEAAHTVWLTPWAMGLLATAGALLSAAYSFRLLAGTFLGPVRDDYPHAPHDPGMGLWIGPAVLVALGVAIGLFPMTVAAWLVDAAAGAVIGAPIHQKIALWHGLEAPALWMSLAAIGGGLALVGLYPRLRALWDAAPVPEAKAVFDRATGALADLSRWVTGALHDGSLTRAVAIGTVTMLVAAGMAFATGSHAPGTRAMMPPGAVAAVLWAILVIAALATALRHHDRMLALILTGIVGLILSAGFAYLSAPDLALTQLSVEVVTVLLMLIALDFLPKETPRDATPARRLRHGALAVLTGLGTAALAFALMTREAAFAPISAFHLAQSKPGAGGTNVVNTIIVDFRGYDTFGEIVVLGIAALVIFAVTEAILSEPRALAALVRGRRRDAAGDPNPMMLAVAARLLLPLAVMVGIFLYLRGHNLPGGGFVAGLVVAIALLLQYIASGFAWSQARQRWAHHSLIGAGVLIAWVAGVGAYSMGLPFLTSGYRYVTLWPLETFELTTASVFDLGVFLCVLGAVMLSLASLSRLARAAAEASGDSAPPLSPEGVR